MRKILGSLVKLYDTGLLDGKEGRWPDTSKVEAYCEKIEADILTDLRKSICRYCNDGSPVGKVIGGTTINGMYAHRINNHNLICEADLLMRRMETND